MTRKDQIRAVKDVFKTLKKLELLEWDYIYPKKANDDKTLVVFKLVNDLKLIKSIFIN
jgi:hypothetical protein